MSKSVVTHVTIVSANEVTEEEAEQMKENHGVDTLDEVADELEDSVESLLAFKVFGDADRLPILDVSTEVEEDMDIDEVGEVRA